MRLLGKALSERHQQLERALEANLPPQQRPHHASFLPQKADPRLRVGGHAQIGLADMPSVTLIFCSRITTVASVAPCR